MAASGHLLDFRYRAAFDTVSPRRHDRRRFLLLRDITMGAARLLDVTQQQGNGHRYMGSHIFDFWRQRRVQDFGRADDAGYYLLFTCL